MKKDKGNIFQNKIIRFGQVTINVSDNHLDQFPTYRSIYHVLTINSAREVSCIVPILGCLFVHHAIASIS